MKTVGVIGAGAWGTALAQVLASNGRDATIWAREPEVAEAIDRRKENPAFLPGMLLSKNLKATDDLAKVARKDVLLLVTPAQHVRATLKNLKPYLREAQPIVLCAKGIELQTGKLLSEVVTEETPGVLTAVLSGPTFADEIARGLPAAATLAIGDREAGHALQQVIGVTKFRPYISDDIIGAQLGGAIKNVIAIACGIVTGRKMGDSARAALLTRGIAEIARLGEPMGARTETLLGMCGIGDLMLTGSSMKSRNYSFGVALGEGRTVEEILGTRKAVTEGVHTARATLDLAKQKNVDMPITAAVNACLNEGVSIDAAIEDMLSRPFTDEIPRLG